MGENDSITAPVAQPDTAVVPQILAKPKPDSVAARQILAKPKPDTVAAPQIIVGPMPLSTADSLALASPGYVPDITKAREIEYTPLDPEEEDAAELPPPATWETGLEGIPRPVYVGDNSGVLAVVAGIFVLMMLSYRHCRRLFVTMVQELWGMRRRANVFDEHTSNESRVVTLMVLQWCVCTGLLLYSGLSITGCEMPPADAFVDTAKLICLMAAYYVVQLIAYNLVGYTFVGNTGRRLWLQGFTASQSLLGFALLIPALVAIFYPNAAEIAVITGVVLYILARILFIAKGFRIFYTNFGSLLYFILYLCTLEIVPVIFVYFFALFLVNSL